MRKRSLLNLSAELFDQSNEGSSSFFRGTSLELNAKSSEGFRNSGGLVETVVDNSADEVFELGLVEWVLLHERLTSSEDIVHDRSEGHTESLGSVGEDGFLGEVGLGSPEKIIRFPDSIVLSQCGVVDLLDLIESDSALQAPSLGNEVDELLDFGVNFGGGGNGSLEAIVVSEDVLGVNNTEENLEDVSEGLTNGDGLVGKVLISEERSSTNEGA